MTTLTPEATPATVVARIREAMEFRCFTVEELSGASGIPVPLPGRRFVDPQHMLLDEVDRITRACQVPVLFLVDAQEGDR